MTRDDATGPVATRARSVAFRTAQVLLLVVALAAVVLVATVCARWIAAAGSVPGALGRAGLSVLAIVVGLAVLPVVVKWLVVGRFRVHDVPVGSFAHLRMWLVGGLVLISPARLLAGTPPYHLYLRALGMQVGRGAVVATRSVPVCCDLVGVGEGAVVHRRVRFDGYRIDDDVVSTGYVHVGRDAEVGAGSLLDIGTVLGDGASLAPRSGLAPGQRVEAGVRMAGSPARRVGGEPEVDLWTAAVRAPRASAAGPGSDPTEAVAVEPERAGGEPEGADGAASAGSSPASPGSASSGSPSAGLAPVSSTAVSSASASRASTGTASASATSASASSVSATSVSAPSTGAASGSSSQDLAGGSLFEESREAGDEVASSAGARRPDAVGVAAAQPISRRRSGTLRAGAVLLGVAALVIAGLGVSQALTLSGRPAPVAARQSPGPVPATLLDWLSDSADPAATIDAPATLRDRLQRGGVPAERFVPAGTLQLRTAPAPASSDIAFFSDGAEGIAVAPALRGPPSTPGAGAALARNPGLRASEEAREVLRSGVVDSRTLAVLAVLAVRGDVDVRGLPAVEGETAAVPLHQVLITAPDAATRDWLAAQQPPFAPRLDPGADPNTVILSWPVPAPTLPGP